MGRWWANVRGGWPVLAALVVVAAQALLPLAQVAHLRGHVEVAGAEVVGAGHAGSCGHSGCGGGGQTRDDDEDRPGHEHGSCGTCVALAMARQVVLPGGVSLVAVGGVRPERAIELASVVAWEASRVRPPTRGPPAA